MLELIHYGGSGNDTFTIANATEGDNDTIDGYGGTDTLELSTGAHTFATDGNLANIEDVKVHSSGSTLDLTNQTENFNVTVGAGTDTVTGGDGVETFIILNAGEGNNDTFTGGAGTDIIQLSSGSHTFSTDNKVNTIETFVANASGSTLVLTGQTEGFTISGGAGVDDLTGGNADDIITGGAENDTLVGGTGNDTFNIDSGTDIITLIRWR